MVPRPEKKMLGGGEMADSCVGHCSLSVDTKGCSLLSVILGWRLARAWMLVIEGSERRVERAWEPWYSSLAIYLSSFGAWKAHSKAGAANNGDGGHSADIREIMAYD